MLSLFKIKLLYKSKQILLSKKHLVNFYKKEIKDIFLDRELKGDNTINEMPLSLKEDKEYLKEYIKLNPKEFELLSEIDRNDKDFCDCLIKNAHYAVGRFGENLKNDKDYAKEIVVKDGHFLECFSKEIKDEEEIVRLAINKDPAAIKYASIRLLKDLELGLLAVSLGGYCYNLIHEDLRRNKRIILALKDYKDAHSMFDYYLSNELAYLKKSDNVFKDLEKEILMEDLSVELVVKENSRKKVNKV